MIWTDLSCDYFIFFNARPALVFSAVSVYCDDPMTLRIPYLFSSAPRFVSCFHVFVGDGNVETDLIKVPFPLVRYWCYKSTANTLIDSHPDLLPLPPFTEPTVVRGIVMSIWLCTVPTILSVDPPAQSCFACRRAISPLPPSRPLFRVVFAFFPFFE